ITPNGVDISAVKQGSSFYGIPSVKLLHPNGFQVGLGLFSPDHVFRKKCKVLSQGRAMVRGTQGDQSCYGMGMVIDVFSGDQPPLTVGDDVKPLAESVFLLQNLHFLMNLIGPVGHIWSSSGNVISVDEGDLITVERPDPDLIGVVGIDHIYMVGAPLVGHHL